MGTNVVFSLYIQVLDVQSLMVQMQQHRPKPDITSTHTHLCTADLQQYPLRRAALNLLLFGVLLLMDS